MSQLQDAEIISYMQLVYIKMLNTEFSIFEALKKSYFLFRQDKTFLSSLSMKTTALKQLLICSDTAAHLSCKCRNSLLQQFSKTMWIISP